MISPFSFPVTADTFNFVSFMAPALQSAYNQQACVILGAATIFAILSWLLIPEDRWLSRRFTDKAFQAADDPNASKDESLPGMKSDDVVEK